MMKDYLERFANRVEFVAAFESMVDCLSKNQD
jgi:hypothetical protein